MSTTPCAHHSPSIGFIDMTRSAFALEHFYFTSLAYLFALKWLSRRSVQSAIKWLVIINILHVVGVEGISHDSNAIGDIVIGVLGTLVVFVYWMTYGKLDVLLNFYLLLLCPIIINIVNHIRSNKHEDIDIDMSLVT